MHSALLLAVALLAPVVCGSLLPFSVSGFRKAGPSGLQQLQQESAGIQSKPWFCHDLECPPYQVRRVEPLFTCRSTLESLQWLGRVMCAKLSKA